MLVDKPDNVWRDRYLLCEDCERRHQYERLPPRERCNNSTLIELDMTVPFSRDNVMATSCELVQLVREGKWIFKNEDGSIIQAKQKLAPAFPVQICCVCRKTSLNEGRRFKCCPKCEGASYCSESCWASHNLKHQVGGWDVVPGGTFFEEVRDAHEIKVFKNIFSHSQ